jgi:predicted nucleic acid-binding protein
MIYFDTSFVAPLVLPEAASARVEGIMQRMTPGEVAVSHWTRVEFAGLVARRVRMRELTEQLASRAVLVFERLLAESYQVILPTASDFNLATRLLQHYRTGLRSGDALHLAIAQNHNANRFFTLDARLIKAAKLVGIQAGSES